MFVINMPSHKIMLLFFFISFLHSATTQAQPVYTNSSCSGRAFAANSSFQSDLTNLLSSLASNKTANNDFYNTTVHRGRNTIYGLFMCRGDVTLELCHQCVVDATKNIRSQCNVSREAVIWYEECMVRYSDRYFFSSVNTSAGSCGANTNNVANNQTGFMNLLSTTMNKAADEAAKSGMGKKNFATEEASLQFQTMYCLVQCTPDLSPQGCRTCLRDAIGDLFNCSFNKIGGRVLYPSCNVRYELFIFYNSNMKVSDVYTGKAKTIVIVVVSVGGGGILFSLVYYLLRSLIRKRRRAELRQKYFGDESNTLEPLQFSLATIEAATNKFSQENCLGQGGFGQVYKGILSNGQEIAVKRLSKGSGQGAAEFKNEVLLIARLQHRNLVTLLGFCIEDQEKILIYEYVPNKSLDYILFGSQENRRLTWEERYEIIRGVARGILYLHEYSRLKIIHRDLKPSNILLDNEMNPKISDFGLARMVAINENEGNTRRIVGTYGYMPPEYAMFGLYSEKSDVFSFGVIILEIISGKKNASCHDESQYADSLLSYTWNQWSNEKLFEMLDSNLKEMESYNEVSRCIQIGLLCVQRHPDSRPSMATVVSYLSNDSIQLPHPQQPAFFLRARRVLTSASREYSSINEMSMSDFFPR
ncbi:cysteine-rich receptor-like protein kinase 10 [Neltuma alba]|uniref:cysteine-rich receptor-like protein kinase 10 n=1 Tax=Neltuma alba TaxID=207710 RepID=UPI0010A2EA4F|nr:cysteine-rich receptor-like protein kinase 10 [Prosopis alba]XP_028788799.1 cysteine-rich receptor-like protein kinase 10 [Prosopis alba]